MSDSEIIAEEETEFTVVLSNMGADEVAVIKAVRAVTGSSLVDAKNLVESAPVVLVENVSMDVASQVKAVPEAVGASVEIR